MQSDMFLRIKALTNWRQTKAVYSKFTLSPSPQCAIHLGTFTIRMLREYPWIFLLLNRLLKRRPPPTEWINECIVLSGCLKATTVWKGYKFNFMKCKCLFQFICVCLLEVCIQQSPFVTKSLGWVLFNLISLLTCGKGKYKSSWKETPPGLLKRTPDNDSRRNFQRWMKQRNIPMILPS